MDTILIKIFAAALALSQVLTRPEAVKTQFDPVGDRTEVVQLLRAGCDYMRRAFDIESINLDDLIATAMDDPKAVAGELKAVRGINLNDLNTAYRQFCKNESVDKPVVDLGQVIEFFNRAAVDLPDQSRLKGTRLPGMSVVLDGKGEQFAEMFEPGNRRIWVPLRDVPGFVQSAFVAAEDRRFYQHRGVDERGIIRAFIGNLADPGRPQGGSTITQQVVKNLLVGEDVTYERKIREMIVASRLESTLSKAEILELYLNSAYLGRGSWGVEMAARSYFGKTAKTLTLAEGAMLAGLLKGPNYFNPDRHPDRARQRLAYVVGRMEEDNLINAEQKSEAVAALPTLVAYDRPRRDTGFQFTDYLGREVKTTGVGNLTANSYTVHSTINVPLQRAVEATLQDGLAQFEQSNGRMQFQGPEANLAEAVQRIAADKADKTGGSQPPWQEALESMRLPLYDVHWTPAVVVEKGGKKGGETIRVGLRDGRVVPLTAWTGQIRRSLSLHDVVYVRVVEPKGADKSKAKGKPPAGAHAQLRVRPTVQGAAIVLENKTGRILAMAGSFSYPVSQLNRAAQSQRQPGSALKPLTYLAALQHGLQPNTLVLDQPITLPPVGSGNLGRSTIISRNLGGSGRDEDYWTPKNADNSSGGVYTLRRGLENSRNIVTARLLDGGIEAEPEQSLDKICGLAIEAKIYSECVRYYPFVLGAQPVRLIDLAAFYAAIANEGARPSPHSIDSIEQDGRTVYQHPGDPPPRIGSADRASFYQLKTMLQGVLERGTARSMRGLAPYIGGKTGTTDNAVDAWFMGFNNDVTVGVWVGYDNADGKRRSLGPGATGARVAIPIFEPIMQAVWALKAAPKVALSGPSREAQRRLVDLQIDLGSGDRVTGGRGFVEHFRLDADGRFTETQHQLVSREEAYGWRGRGTQGDGEWVANDQGYWVRPFGNNGYWSNRSYVPFSGWQQQQPAQQQPAPQPRARGLFGQPRFDDQEDERQRARRRDPDYLWGGRFN